MIGKLVLYNTATFKNKVEVFPTAVNYFYGSNGSGKTTISKLINNPTNYKDCEVIWENSNQLEALVYNKDFVDKNFSNNSSIKGIFTLGQDTKDTKEFIERAKEKIDRHNKELVKLASSLTALVESKSSLICDTLEKCWSIKKKYDDTFRKVFIGFIGSKEAFMKKCLEEENNDSDLLEFETLKQMYTSIFNTEVKEYLPIPKPDYSQLNSRETSEILNKVVTGKTDLEIGALVVQLQNSDWVRKGLEYFNLSNGKCPFCQQMVSDALKSEIESFFDETFERDCKKLKEFRESYYAYFSSKIDELKQISLKEIECIDFSEFNQKIAIIETIFSENLKVIDKKIETPSIKVTITSLKPNFQEIDNYIDEFCEKITINNDMVKNIASKKKEVISKVWKFITNEMKIDLEQYKKKKNGIEKGEEKINSSIKQYKESNHQLQSVIMKKEAEVTSIIHTVNEINRILIQFGFTGFKIAEAGERGSYKIVREDGTDVKETLSEGEYRFITFLYFYQLIKGSTDKSGLTKDKVVVIDDPISSLDSSILFIVSTLVKNIIYDCFENVDGIKQVFILTHNVYFHKEITFRGSRENKSKKEIYWIVQKANNISEIKSFDENPIQTTYELLWRELDNVNRHNTATIYNTLRRILEYYFNIIGGLNYEECINNFEGEEKLLCKSLVSCINDGSHFINDDYVICFDPDNIDKYLKVFKLIFEKMGHGSHYNMMTKGSMAEVAACSE